MKKKVMAGWLAALLTLLSLVSCAGGNDGKETDTQARTDLPVESETVNPMRQALDAVGEVDWGKQEFGILHVDDIAGYTEEVKGELEADDGFSSAVISEAVHERNTLFEERCHLQFVRIPVSNGSITGKVQNEVRTKSGDFHMVSAMTDLTANMATSMLLADYMSLDIDYDDKAWWDQGTLDFALDGKVFLMHGGFDIVDDDVTFVFFFNKALQKEYQIPNLYDTVRDGKWTLDRFNELAVGLAVDEGDGKWDEKDTYGFVTPGSIGDTFFYGSDLQYVRNSRDMDMPELALNEAKLDKAATLLTKLNGMLHGGSHMAYIAKSGSESLSLQIFSEGRALFYCEAASYLRHLNSGMEGDYGVLPIPKYDEAQEFHTTWTHGIGSALSLPANAPAKDRETFSKVLEVYAILSQLYVRPAYYDVMMTTRTVRDPESANMLDIIFAHRIYDMARYFSAIGIGGFGDSVVANNDSFVSRYTKSSRNFDRNVQRLLAKIQKADQP